MFIIFYHWSCYCLISVSRGQYSTPCISPDNVCIDTNTQCVQGLCQCSNGHFRRGNVCGEYYMCLNLLTSRFACKLMDTKINNISIIFQRAFKISLGRPWWLKFVRYLNFHLLWHPVLCIVNIYIISLYLEKDSLPSITNPVWIIYRTTQKRLLKR